MGGNDGKGITVKERGKKKRIQTGGKLESRDRTHRGGKFQEVPFVRVERGEKKPLGEVQ